MEIFDVLVVGNGVLGLSTAYALTLEDPHLKIAVIGPFKRKGGATLAAGAMLNCFAEIDKHTFQSKHTLNKFNIAKQALKMWPSWIEQINSKLNFAEKLTINPGTFVILNAKAGKREDENYRAILDALKLYQESYEEVECSDIPGINAIDTARPLRSLYLPNEGALSPKRLLAALEKVSLQNGNITFLDDCVTKILFDKNKIIGIQTKSMGSLKASQVILAAGAYSQTLIEQIPSLTNRIPKILAAPGCSLILKVDSHQFTSTVRTPVRSGSCGIHILPYDQKSQTLYMGATNTLRLFPKTKPKARDVYYLLEHAMEQFNQELHSARMVKWQVGNRPVTLDTFPLIGETSVEGLWILTGTYRDGLHDSPLLAMSLAKEILKKNPLFTHGFQPERFPIETMTKEQTAIEFVDQYVSWAFEHSMKLPVTIGGDIRNLAYKRLESIYSELEIDIGLPIDVLVMLYWEPERIPLLKEYYQTVKKEFSATPYLKEIEYV